MNLNFLSAQTYFFPLYLFPDDENSEKLFDQKSAKKVPNLNPEILKKIETKLNLKFGKDFSSENLFDYIYAVLHAPKFRKKFREFLKIDFPKIPFECGAETFFKLAELGEKLRKLHLLEFEISEQKNIPIFDGDGNFENKIEFVKLENGEIKINDGQFFAGVEKEIWEFPIGGYFPAQKFLKDRKNRQLSTDEVFHFQKILISIRETIFLMREIDTVFEF